MLTCIPEIFRLSGVVNISCICVSCFSPAVTASTASKVPKPGFGFDWNTGGPLYKP